MVEGDRRISLALADGHNIRPCLQDFLIKAGFQVTFKENGIIHAEVADDPLLGSVTLNSSRDIPLRLDEGVNHFGMLGRDELVEAQLGGVDIQELIGLDISVCKVVLEIPKEVRYRDPKQLAGMRIATRFPNMTRKYFADQDRTEVRIVPYSGKEEGAYLAGAADAVVANYVTGGSADENALKAFSPLKEGTLLDSEAVLAASSEFMRERGGESIVCQFIYRIRQTVQASQTSRISQPLSEATTMNMMHVPRAVHAQAPA